MGWLLLIAAILALVFPPLAIVVLALMITGVFAKGMDATADGDEQADGGHRRGGRRCGVVVYPQVRQPQSGQIIDVPSYPVTLPEPLPAPVRTEVARELPSPECDLFFGHDPCASGGVRQ